MIRRERLAELLKTNSTIYTTYGGYVSEIELVFGSDRIEEKHLVELCVEKWGNTYTRYTFDMLFEDELEAEEFLKYGNITRTEKFPYISWEEFCNGESIRFTTKDNYRFTCEVAIYSDLGKTIVIHKPLIAGWIFKEPLTRENYLKALDICVKLFKGEEV